MSKRGDEVLEITRYFIETLADMHVEKDWIQPWFSGTGFHVDIPELYGLIPSNDLPNIMAFVKHLADSYIFKKTFLI